MSRNSLFPAGLVLVGEVEGRGDLDVAGTIEGPIEVQGELIIEEEGRVIGDIRAKAIVIRGVLDGNATATDTVLIEETASVVGNARAGRVNIHRGARFRGRVQMTAEPETPVRRRRGRPAEALEANDTERVDRIEEGGDGSTAESERSRGRQRDRRRARRRGRGESGRRSDARPDREASSLSDRDREESDRERSSRSGRERSGRSDRGGPVPAAAEPASGSAPRTDGPRRPPAPVVPAVKRRKARRKERPEPQLHSE